MQISVNAKTRCFHSFAITPFSSNVPFTDKPGTWFLLAKMFEKHLRKSDILSKDASHRPSSLLKCHSFTGVFQTFC